MRRAALAATCAALAAALLTASAGGAPAEPGGRHFTPYTGEMATTQCVAWQKHRKRVVKRVRRGGEWKRVVRVKRWRSCARRAAAPAAPVTAPAPTPPGPPQPQPVPEDPAIPRLGVKAEDTPDFRFTLSRPEVPAGEVVVELQNMGEDPHNLHLQLEDGSGPQGEIATIGPGVQGKAKFALPAGSYRLWCDLDEHEARGMKATLVVAG